MDVLDTVKKVADLAKKGLTVELQEKIMELREEVLAIKEEVVSLRQENQALKDACPENKEKPIGTKWGCYQFVDDDGLYCTGCYDTKGKKIRTTRATSRYRMCPVCNAAYS